MRTTNKTGIDLIKRLEGCVLVIYPDEAGLPTVGYGHMDKSLVLGDRITQDQADKLFAADIRKVEIIIDFDTPPTLTENQFAALVSFAFNVGLAAYEGSTLAKLIKVGDYAAASLEFAKWKYVTRNATKIVSKNLVARRKSEKALFLS